MFGITISVPEPLYIGAYIWQVGQQGGNHLIVGGIGRRQFGSQWDPDAGDGADQVQLPAVDPALPAALGPVGLRVDAGMRDHAGGAVLGMPDATTGVQHRGVDRHGSAARGPGLELLDQTVA